MSERPDALCPRCGVRPVDADGTPWLFLLLAWIATLGLMPGPSRQPLCGECAGGFHFLGLLMLAVLVGTVFVVAIVVLG